MKTKDFTLLAALVVVLSPFFLCPSIYAGYEAFNATHPYITAFLKFALLATAGETVGLRIKTGFYSEPGFGLLPRAVVWGVLGAWIAAAMKIYASGVPLFAEGLGIEGVAEAMKGGFSGTKLIGALMTSIAMNTTLAPVFMTIHKVTDTHILANGGSYCALLRPIPVGTILAGLNWQVMWGFVFKRTIPLFWIPAHTITFLLPGEFQVLFAALLGVMLGILLSVAAVQSRR